MGILILHGSVVRMKGDKTRGEPGPALGGGEVHTTCLPLSHLSSSCFSACGFSQDNRPPLQRWSGSALVRPWAAVAPEGSETWHSCWKAWFPSPPPRGQKWGWKIRLSGAWDVLSGLETSALKVTVLSDFRFNSLYGIDTLVWKLSVTLAPIFVIDCHIKDGFSAAHGCVFLAQSTTSVSPWNWKQNRSRDPVGINCYFNCLTGGPAQQWSWLLTRVSMFLGPLGKLCWWLKTVVLRDRVKRWRLMFLDQEIEV